MLNTASSFLTSTTGWYVIVGAIAYTVGRVGVPTLYQDIKHLLQGIKGAVSGAKAAVTAPTTTPTTPAA
jgi:hypothetical protein